MSINKQELIEEIISIDTEMDKGKVFKSTLVSVVIILVSTVVSGTLKVFKSVVFSYYK